jgi:hypothetical protein
MRRSLNTASNRQEANRNTILIRRQTGFHQPLVSPAIPENWLNARPESTD